MPETEQAWPFAPGDVVRDSGLDRDVGAWIDAAPLGTVLVDADGDEWTVRKQGLCLEEGRLARPPASVDEHHGPLIVVSVGTEPTEEESVAPSSSASRPVGPCASCGAGFETGDYWWYHARLGVYVHQRCGATRLVRGEDISTHTVLSGQIQEAAR